MGPSQLRPSAHPIHTRCKIWDFQHRDEAEWGLQLFGARLPAPKLGARGWESCGPKAGGCGARKQRGEEELAGPQGKAPAAGLVGTGSRNVSQHQPLQKPGHSSSTPRGASRVLLLRGQTESPLPARRLRDEGCARLWGHRHPGSSTGMWVKGNGDVALFRSPFRDVCVCPCP